jgi:hypothetical protein
MYNKKLYETAYALKEEDQGIHLMNELCSNIEQDISINDIADIMRLYSDNATNSEQNEFVTEVINNVVLINPELSSQIIIKNIDILIQEGAIGCITYIFLIFIHWNKELTDIFLDALVNADVKNSNIIINELVYEINNDYDELYDNLLKRYYAIKA